MVASVALPRESSFRQLVAKTLAKQFSTAVNDTCAPFQFALSTRAGVDCVGHAVRFATDADPEATVLSVDGVGAYDPCVPMFHDVEVMGDAQLPEALAVREISVWEAVVLQVERFRRRVPRCPRETL